MAALLYKDDHNKVAYLEKGKGSEAYEQILDFLNRSDIRYALTHHPPIVFDSLVKQFWATATVRTLEAGPSEIIATIDGNEVVVTESLIRTQLHLNDANGLYEFTLHDVLDGMREIGYPTDGSLTFYKAKLSPQWRFLIHILIYLKMEIPLEPTSNKLMVDSILQAGNPVKKILLKLNLPDHRILKDGGECTRFLLS
nr:xylulose kinase-1 [Tanacetum cinerariifolium]